VNKGTPKLDKILHEYSQLPEYSGMDVPDVHSMSLFGDFPINIAATRGLIDEARVLLSHGANINCSGEHGYTPLHNAVEQGHLEMVKFLVDHDARVDIKNSDGDTPKDLAKLLGEDKIHDLIEK